MARSDVRDRVGDSPKVGQEARDVIHGDGIVGESGLSN
jgi:hypothetical protein